MLGKAVIATCVLTAVTAGLLFFYLVPSKPKMNVVSASLVFDRYPHWQASAADSREVVLDPAIERAQAAKFAPPASLRGDPYGIWQPERTTNIVVEFGVGRGLNLNE